MTKMCWMGVSRCGLLCLLALCLAACEYEIISETPKGNILRELHAEGQLASDGQQSKGQAQLRHRHGYSVELATLRGPDRFLKGESMVRALREQGGLADLWTVDRGATLTLFHSRFSTDNDPKAKLAVKQAKSLEIEGKKLFEKAKIVALGAQEQQRRTASLGEFNLAQYSGQGLLSLEIAFYDEAFGPTFRKAAEDAAAALREDGDQAYFYHGPHRSMVTIGLYSWDDFVLKGNQEAYGPAIKQMQEKFPYTLYNGVTVIQKNKHGETLGELKSRIVRIP